MSNSLVLLTGALVNGVLLSLVLTAIAVVSGAIALDMWVGDYPPDIRERFGPMSRRAARLRPFVAAVFFTAVIAVPFFGLFGLDAQLGSVSFLPAVAFVAVSLVTFNVYDLLILDWLLFCTIQPSSMVLPGTAGMAGYRDYHFHFIGFLKGLGFTVVGSLIIAGLFSAVQTLT